MTQRSILVAAIAAVLIAIPAAARAASDELGSVNTEFKLLGPDNKIVVSAFDDPEIPGVACFLSRARTGGVKGMVGVAEDTSDAAIACRQTGPIALPAKLPAKAEVFTERRSVMFKHLRVVRFWDAKRRTLVYLAYSDKLVNGSPKNSVSAVPVMPWPAAAAGG
ncbi:MAG TPA: CreA family protein [Alphaproteobacteria bacterium]|nr:CreA family protein [Alphaproteobacteria bacterium]